MTAILDDDPEVLQIQGSINSNDIDAIEPPGKTRIGRTLHAEVVAQNVIIALELR